MKILNLVTFLLLLILFVVGAYFAIAIGKQTENQNYSDFIKTSSSKVLVDINKQSQGINEIDNLVETEDETIANLEAISGGFKTTLNTEKENWKKTQKPLGTENVEAKMEAFLAEAEESNKKFDELLSDIKELEGGEEILDRLQSYNTNVSEFSLVYDELANELNNFVETNKALKI